MVMYLTKHVFPQGWVLEPLLFLIYAIKFCKVHHFADDANLVNKYINIDLKI